MTMQPGPSTVRTRAELGAWIDQLDRAKDRIQRAIDNEAEPNYSTEKLYYAVEQLVPCLAALGHVSLEDLHELVDIAWLRRVCRS